MYWKRNVTNVSDVSDRKEKSISSTCLLQNILFHEKKYIPGPSVKINPFKVTFKAFIFQLRKSAKYEYQEGLPLE